MTFNYKMIFKIVKDSFNRTLRWNIWKYLLTGGFGSLLGTLQFGKNFFDFDIYKSVRFAIYAIIGIFLIRFIIALFIDSLKYFQEVYRNSTYGNAIIELKNSFAHLHLYRKTPGHKDEQFMTAMVILCNNLKSVYDNITYNDCSVSIKVPLSDKSVNEKTVLMNLTRDSLHSQKDTPQNRDTEKYKQVKHTLIGNTAFINSFNKVIKNIAEKHYINNDVNNTINYDNTSKDCYKDGKLPYNSELVYPIVPLMNSNKTNFDCHGFICVDCEKPNAFKNNYDIAILEGVADGIYDIISERNNTKNKSNEEIQN